MPIGPGKYDAWCTEVRQETNAGAVLLIVLDGVHGSGFSCQADLATTLTLPELLERVAADIRRDGVASHEVTPPKGPSKIGGE
jgi:hypothetical protein